jgi:hypothetical protein
LQVSTIAILKRTFRQARLRNVLSFALLIAAGVAVGTTAAQSRRCPSCFYLRTLSENFDNVTPPALPMEWLATNALGPPPLRVNIEQRAAHPTCGCTAQRRIIDNPAVVSDKRLDSLPFSFSKAAALS